MTISIDDDIAQLDAAREQDKGDATQAALVKSGGQAQSTGVSEWVMNLPKNIGVGLFDAAVNTVKTVGEMGSGGVLDKKTVQEGSATLIPNDPGEMQRRREASLAAEPSQSYKTFARNQRFAKPVPAGGYLTKLPAADEAGFQSWVKQNKVPFDPSAQADYDMRGFYKALQAGDPRATTGVNKNDGKLHFGDYWKTPYHKSFSNESQFANESAPKWNEKDQLVTPTGQVVFDERAPQPEEMAAQHDNVMTHVMAFRDHLADNSSTADVLTQNVAQFAVPFMGWSKLLGVAGAASTVSKVARVAGAEAATAATAFDPQAPRMADLYALGQHTEGKLGEALNAAAPDGSLLNHYIDYMTDRTDEGAAEGRFKNVVDNLVASGVTAGLLKTGAASLKAARKLPGYVKPGAIPMPESAPLLADNAPARALAERSVQQYGDVPTAIVHLTEAGNASATLAEKEHFYSAADHIRQTAPPGVGVKVVESPQGFTIVHGNEPSLTFTKKEDADAAIVDMHGAFGAAFEGRQAQARATLTDSNFDTLHSFTRVLQKNVDRPVSTHSLITALHGNLKGDTEQGAFYKELLGRLKDKNLGGTTTVTSESAANSKAHGEFFLRDNSVKLYPRAFQDSTNLLHTFVHEAVHVATLREMRESPAVYRQIERLFRSTQKAVNDAEESVLAGQRVKAEKALAEGKPLPSTGPKLAFDKHSDRYGFTNPDEFVAEIESNPRFRAVMKKVQDKDGATVWDKYLKAIAGILGITGLAVNPEFSKLMDPKQENDTGG